MKHEHHNKLWLLYWAYVGVSVLNIGLAMLTTKDTRWMQWHLSRLGEGIELPAAVFNFGLGVTGVIFFLLCVEIAKHVTLHKKTTWRLITVASIVLVQLLGLAAFPYDRFPRIHDFFGYGMFYVCSSLLFFSRYITPYAAKRTKIAGLIIAILAGIPMVLYQFFGVGTLLAMELYGTAWMFVWVWLLVRDVRQPHHKVLQ